MAQVKGGETPEVSDEGGERLAGANGCVQESVTEPRETLLRIGQL